MKELKGRPVRFTAKLAYVREGGGKTKVGLSATAEAVRDLYAVCNALMEARFYNTSAGRFAVEEDGDGRFLLRTSTRDAVKPLPVGTDVWVSISPRTFSRGGAYGVGLLLNAIREDTDGN